MKKYLIFIFVITSLNLALPANPPDTAGTDTDPQKLEDRLTASTGEKRVEILLELTRFYRGRYPRKAVNYGTQALEYLQADPSDEKQIILLNELSAACILLAEYKNAEEYALQIRTIAQRTGKKTGEADALFNLGKMHWHQSNYTRAEDYCSQALNIYEEAGDQEGIAKCSVLMGNIYRRTSSFSRALESVLKSASIYEKLDDKKGMADSDSVAGSVYWGLGEYQKAVEYFLKAKQAYRELDEKTSSARIFNSIAIAYSRLEQYPEAVAHYKKSIELSRETEYKQILSYALNNIGEIYAEMKEYQRAHDHFKQSLAIKEQINDKMAIAYTLVNVGRTYRRQEQYKAALPPLEQALAISSELNTRDEMRNASKELSETHEALNNHTKALHYFKKFKEINDSIFNDANRNKIMEMQSRHKMEKKEREIQLLKKDSEIRELDLARQRNLKNSLIIVSALVLILAFVIYTRYRLKTRVTRALAKEIDEHKQTEQKLRESEEKFRVLAEKSVVGIYIIQGAIIKYVNPTFAKIWGYQPEELIGIDSAILVAEEDRKSIREKLNQRLNGTDEMSGSEFKGLTRNGRIVHVENFGALTQFQGKTAIMGTAIDITARKTAEAELLKSRKLESIGILAGGIAHDFNNLLAIIIGNISLAMEEIHDNASAMNLLKSAETASNQATDLAQKLITFSKGGWIDPRELPLSTLFHSTAKRYPHLEPLLQNISIPPQPAAIHGDEQQLRQVMHHLLENAAEAMTGIEHKKVSITVDNINLNGENEFSLKEGNYVKISIQDNGSGIPEEHLDKVFDPYFSTKDTGVQKGMGLGLAICFSIIKRHNGHITIQSEVGKGTVVDIYLPAAD
jgi:PAS domain S-box-containing protein